MYGLRCAPFQAAAPTSAFKVAADPNCVGPLPLTRIVRKTPKEEDLCMSVWITVVPYCPGNAGLVPAELQTTAQDHMSSCMAPKLFAIMIGTDALTQVGAEMRGKPLCPPLQQKHEGNSEVAAPLSMMRAGRERH